VHFRASFYHSDVSGSETGKNLLFRLHSNLAQATSEVCDADTSVGLFGAPSYRLEASSNHAHPTSSVISVIGTPAFR